MIHTSFHGKKKKPLTKQTVKLPVVDTYVTLLHFYKNYLKIN